MFLGSEAFVAALRQRLDADADLSEIPGAQKRHAPKPLSHYAEQYGDRDVAFAEAYASGGYTLREIGEYFGLHYSRVSRIVRRREWVSGETWASSRMPAPALGPGPSTVEEGPRD